MLTETEQIQINALRHWWAKIKEKAKKLGWKYGKESYKHKNGTLVVILLDASGNKHFLQISTTGDISFAPATMSCF